MRKKHIFLIEIGKKIREIRKEKNFSQEELAFESELHPNYIGGIERGERNVAALNLLKIANALKVEVGDLFPSTKDLINKN